VPSRYESLVSAGRPNDAHGIALQLVGTGKRVLELGAANGHVTKELIARGNSVVAVEIDEDLRAELAAITHTVIIADLDHLDLIDKVNAEQFDVVLAGDVLEHTIHTRLILEEIRQLLKPGGYLVISVPNIAHGDVRLALLNGEFRYRDVGILDRTHRTFFTRNSLVEFLTVNGFTDLEIFGSTTPIGTTEIRPDLSGFSNEIIDLVLRDPLSSVYQYIVKASPINYADISKSEDYRVGPPIQRHLTQYESALIAREQLIIDLKRQLETHPLNDRDASPGVEQVQSCSDELSVSLVRLSEDIAELRFQLRGENLEFRDYALGVLAELGEARAQLLHTEAALGAATREIEQVTERLAEEMTRAYQAEKKLLRLEMVELRLTAVLDSFTWKLGRFFMLPIRVLRRLLRR
jgi:2-polyprenyl-3-methyl-5-hydroxy-6-metoxy-1,4-benzoquinol methylase